MLKELIDRNINNEYELKESDDKISITIYKKKKIINNDIYIRFIKDMYSQKTFTNYKGLYKKEIGNRSIDIANIDDMDISLKLKAILKKF